jgi:hypothetical protein
MADEKITELTEDTSPAAADLLATVDDPGGTPITKKSTIANVLKNVQIVEDTTPQLGGQLDVNGNAIGDGTLELLTFVETGSAVNHIQITNNTTTNPPSILPAGDDSSIDLQLGSKGTGGVNVIDAAFFNEATLTDAANISWDVAPNPVAKVTLTANRTLDNPTNMKVGATYLLRVIQDAGGTNTLAYDTAYLFPGGTAPVLSVAGNAIDIISFYSDGTSMYGSILKGFA